MTESPPGLGTAPDAEGDNCLKKNTQYLPEYSNFILKQGLYDVEMGSVRHGSFLEHNRINRREQGKLILLLLGGIKED